MLGKIQMHWHVLAPFCQSEAPGQWLAPFVNKDRHTFSFVPGISAGGASWHGGFSKRMPWANWAGYVRQVGQAKRRNPSGVIALFPQLSVVAGMRIPAVLKIACLFNVGRLYGGMQRRLASCAMRRFARICVSARREIDMYAEWLGISKERFQFFPFQRPEIRREATEETERPFVVSMGSAHRDYRTLCTALERLKIPGVIIAAPHALSGIKVPANVQVIPGGLTMQECRLLAQRARVNVVPLANDLSTTGTVTTVESMRMGCAIVATKCVGTEDYIEPGRTGLLVPPNDPESLTEAIRQLWEDATLRRTFAREADQIARNRLSDETAGIRLTGVLDEAAGCKMGVQHDGRLGVEEPLEVK